MINKINFLNILFIVIFISYISASNIKENGNNVHYVNKSDDFSITGEGNNKNWEKAEWIELTKRKQFEKTPLRTTVKMLYSKTGLYFLFNCQDNKLTSSMNADFMELWNEDVVEVFLWPDENYPVYFEYELSPLNYELPIMVANIDGELLRWQPFYYESNRRTRHKTNIINGKKEPHAFIEGWTAEFFIPYTLLMPLNNVPPRKGEKWRANFYRMDYDHPESISWLWQLTKVNFHDYKNFGTIIFN